MREPISLKELLAIIVKRGALILSLAVLVAAVAGVYQLGKQIELANDPANSVETIQQAYDDELELYEEQLENLNSTLTKTQSKLERQTEYNNDSVLMNLDPYHTAVNTTIIAITGTDEILLQEQYMQKNMTPSYFTDVIQNLYRLYWDSLVLGDELSNHCYEDIPEQYLRELISFNENESGTFTLTVYAEKESDAAKLGEEVYARLMEMKPLIEANTYPHGLSVINRSTKIDIVSDIESRQEEGKTLAKTYLEEINALQEQLEDLEEPKMGKAYDKKTIILGVLKWAILGAFVGVVLACAWILVMFLMRSRVESSRQMEKILGVAFLGSAAKRGGIWKRLGSQLMGERSWKDADQAAAYITESLKSRLEEEQPFAVVSTLRAKDALSVMEKVGAGVRGDVPCVDNAEKNPQTIALLRDCKQIVLAERIGVSNVPEMLWVLELAKEMDVNVVGFVTI